MPELWFTGEDLRRINLTIEQRNFPEGVLADIVELAPVLGILPWAAKVHDAIQEDKPGRALAQLLPFHNAIYGAIHEYRGFKR